MTLGDCPLRPPSRSLTMDMDEDDFDGVDAFEIIDPADLEETGELGSSDEEEEVLGEETEGILEDGEEDEGDRKLSCVPSTDHAAIVFSQHQSSVFCVAVNPADEKCVVSGGQDDKVFVWSIVTGDVAFESNDFSDSVCSTGFTQDGRYFAAADMGGKIVVWRNTSPTYSIAWEEKIGDIQWMMWHPQAHVLLAGEVTGSIYMWKIPSGICKVFGGYNFALTDVGAFMPDGKRALSCYVDGSVRVHNLQTGSCLRYEPSETNQDNFISHALHPDNNLVALGSLSSRLALIKTIGSKSVEVFNCAEEDEKEAETVSTVVECVAFSKSLPYSLLLAATDNALHVIDYVKSDTRGVLRIEEGVTKLSWPEGSHLVYVGTKVGYIAVCDVRAPKRVFTLEGHTNSILDITVAQQGRVLLSTSDDRTVRVFQLSELFAKENFNPFINSG